MADSEPRTIPISVLTGFLGSGKTTVLRHLLGCPGMASTAVIINEFGEIGLDHLLVRSVSEGIIELNSGCLCCTVRSDLIDTMRDLFLKRVRGEVAPFDRVVIETTGLADPGPVLQPLIHDPLIAARFHVAGVITTVDAVNGATQLDEHVESVKQVAVADRLLLTKADMADPATVSSLAARLQQLNGAARIHTVAHGVIAPELLLDAGPESGDVRRWLAAEAYDQHAVSGHGHGHHHDAPDVNRHDARIRAFCLNHDGPIGFDALVAWLDALLREHGRDVLRVKGIVNVAGEPRPVVIHGVHHAFHPPAILDAWPSDDHRTRIVVIARDLAPEVAAALFRSILRP